MRFILSTYRDPATRLDPEHQAGIPRAVEVWCNEMDARGVRVLGNVLAPLDETKTLRIRNGELHVGDGPVSDADTYIAGFNILECRDLDEALEVASGNPGAEFGILELRPLEES